MTNDDTPPTAPNDASPLPPPRSFTAPARPLVPLDAPQPDGLSDAVGRLLHHDGTAVAMLSLDGNVHDLSRPMLDLIGAASVVEVTAGSAADGTLRSFLDQAPTELFRAGDHVWHGRIDHRGATGQQMVFRATVSALHDASAPGGGDLALLMHDITDEDAKMRALLQRATHDPLTGLANRRQVLDRLAEKIRGRRGLPGHVAAVAFDLDDLKYVNTSFGHAAGDRLLVSSARRLAQTIRPTDDVARIGGDEFLAIADDVTDADAALELAGRARGALTGRLHIGELDLALSVSVGVALTDTDLMELDDEDAASTLISRAGYALDQAKSAGRGQSMLFAPPTGPSVRERTQLAGALSQAIASGEIDVEYQPIHSATSGAAVAAEALVRWTHPTSGMIDALTIIEMAEESGSIDRLGEFVLEQALTDLTRWNAEGLVDSEFSVHVNVSHVQLSSPSFVGLVVDRVEHHQLEPAQLVLEARASAHLPGQTDVVRSIRALRRAGIPIAVDDFGTGAKAIEVLTDVGADVLKLDGSLALPAGSSDTDVRLVRAVVLLAHALDIDVVAERVSGQAQLRRLQDAGCDMLQGNLLGYPKPAGVATFAISTLI